MEVGGGQKRGCDPLWTITRQVGVFGKSVFIGSKDWEVSGSSGASDSSGSSRKRSGSSLDTIGSSASIPPARPPEEEWWCYLVYSDSGAFSS